MKRLSSSPEWNEILNLLFEDEVSEFQSNGPNTFFIKRKGKRIHLEHINFPDEISYEDSVIEYLVPHVKSIFPYKKNTYLFEGPLRMDNGEKKITGRCHIVMPPAADSPQITIAKHSTTLGTIEKVAATGTMSTEMMLFLKKCVEASLTLVFSGGTGAGKTTMMTALCTLIPHDIRIGIAEDTPELHLTQKNVIYQHSEPAKPTDQGNTADLPWVVKQFQRQRVDRIIIGETRGAEFAEFLVAANSGMEGSMTTLHANTPVKSLDKMSNFALRGTDRVPIRAINADIAQAIDVVIQLTNVGGRHKITSIQEITDTVGQNEDAKISTQALFVYDPLTDTWHRPNQPTDALREKFRIKKINISDVLSSKIGEKQPPFVSGDARSSESNRDTIKLRERLDADSEPRRMVRPSSNSERSIGGGMRRNTGGIPTPRRI